MPLKTYIPYSTFSVCCLGGFRSGFPPVNIPYITLSGVVCGVTFTFHTSHDHVKKTLMKIRKVSRGLRLVGVSCGLCVV